MAETNKNNFGDKTIGFFKDVFAFFTGITFVKNLLAAITMISVIMATLFLWLDCYTRHDQAIKVSSVLDLPIETAIEKLEDGGFKVEISDSVFVQNKRPNLCVAQTPIAGSKVKSGRTIYLTVSKNNPDQIVLPDLANGNDNYSQYEKIARSLGIRLRIVERIEDKKLAENTIIQVIYKGDSITSSLKSGVKVPKGSVIDLIVTESSEDKVPVPDLVCQKIDAARFLVTNYRLIIGEIVKDKTIRNEQKSYVWKQEPAYSAYAKIRMGDKIKLYITQDVPEDCPGYMPPKKDSIR
jgi:eukaryotic-like serine/threonine-protein kinase